MKPGFFIKKRFSCKFSLAWGWAIWVPRGLGAVRGPAVGAYGGSVPYVWDILDEIFGDENSFIIVLMTLYGL